MNIGDIYMALRGNATGLMVDAQKAGEAAGANAAAEFSASFSGKVKASAGGLVGIGIGTEIGHQIVRGLESAIVEVAQVIPNMLNQGQAFALNVEEMTKKTGASAEAASRFAGTLTYLGQSTEGLGQMLKTLSVEVVNNEDKLNRLGIATRDSSDHLLDTITVLNNLRSYLSRAGDGETKLALATDLLGRSAGNLIEYLNLTDGEVALLNRTLDDLGVTMGSDATAAAEGLAREQNLLALAWQGLANTLTVTVVPALRQFIGAVIEFVSTHGPAIRQTLTDITNTVLGFATALLGVEGITPFQMRMDELGGTTKNTALSFEQWAQQMGYTIPVIKATTTSTKGATGAIDKQTKALDLLEKQQDRTYKKALGLLDAQLDAQLRLMDEQDQKLERERRDVELQRSLREAQLQLAEAMAEQQAKPTDRGLLAIADAQQAVLDAQQAIADEARSRAEDDRRAQIEGVRDYISQIEQLVSDSLVPGETLAELEKRRKALLAGGKPAAGSDRAIELQAVLAAEKRVRQKAANDQKRDDLAALRSSLAAQDSAKVAADKKTLAKLKKQYQAYLADLKKVSDKSWDTMSERILGNGKPGSGLGGALSKAFNDGKEAALAFRAVLDDGKGGGILGAVKAIAKGLSDMMGFLSQPVVKVGLAALAGAAIGGPAGAAAFTIIAGVSLAATGQTGGHGGSTGALIPLPGEQPRDSLQQARKNAGLSWIDVTGHVHPATGARASGGPTRPGFSWVGERGRELLWSPGNQYVLNSAASQALASLNSLSPALATAGISDGSPAIIRVEIGGNRLLDYIDRNLAYRRR